MNNFAKGRRCIFLLDEEKIWMFLMYIGHLYSISPDTGIVRLEKKFTKEEMITGSYYSILKYKNKLIFVPGLENDMIVYDKKTSEIEKIPVYPSPYRVGCYGVNFLSGRVYKDSIFLFGYGYAGIMKYDFIEGKYSIITDWLDGCKGKFTDDSDGCLITVAPITENEVIVPFCNMNAVLHFDMEKEKAEVIHVGEKKQRYAGLDFDGNNWWLIPRDSSTGDVIKWNYCTRTWNVINKYPDGFDRNISLAFTSIKCHDQKIYLLAGNSPQNLVIDSKTNEVSFFVGLEAFRDQMVYVSGDCLVQISDDGICYFDLVSGEKRQVPYIWKDILEYSFRSNITESKEIGLADLINYTKI